jgi:hypothetical protein
LRHTFVPRIRYLGFTTRGKKGPLTTTGDLYACESRTNFDTIINRQQSLAVNLDELTASIPFPLAKWKTAEVETFLEQSRFSNSQHGKVIPRAFILDPCS